MFLFSPEDEKEKLSGDEANSVGGVSGLGPSAALTPAIWDKTIPYDGKTFHLEYMDLEEFLMENGIPASEQVQQKNLAKESSKHLLEKTVTIIPKTEPSSADPISLLPTMELEQCEEEVVTTVISTSDSAQTKTGQHSGGMVNTGCGHGPIEICVFQIHLMYLLKHLVISSLAESGVYNEVDKNCAVLCTP